MTSPNYTIDQGEGDSGGVHTNSGVNNKAAFLMTDGSGSDDLQRPARSPASASTKAARIYYEVETALPDLGQRLRRPRLARCPGCDNLVGTVGITAADCTQVRNAVAAVEMSHQPAAARAPEAPAALPQRQPGAQTGSPTTWRTPAGDGNWSTDDLSALGLRRRLRPQRRHPACSARTLGDRPASARSTGQERRAPGGRDLASCASTTPTGSRTTRHGTSTSTAACSSSAPTAARRSRTSAACRSTSATTATSTTGFDNPLAGRPAFVEREQRLPREPREPELPAGQSVRFRWRIGTDSTAERPRLVHRRRPHLLVPAGHRRRRLPEQR